MRRSSGTKGLCLYILFSDSYSTLKLITRGMVATILYFFAFFITIENNIIINAGFFIYFHPINLNRCPQLIILAVKFKLWIKLVEHLPAWRQKIYPYIKFLFMTIILPKTYNFKKERNINKLLLVNVFAI